MGAVYSSGGTTIKSEKTIDTQATKRRSLIEIDNMLVPRSAGNDPQLSPRLGGPGSAFKPYASSENLYDPSLFPAQRPPLTNGNHGNSDKSSKRYSTSSLKPPRISESDEDFFKPKPSPKVQRAQIQISTTDTEPEMKEFNLGPIGSDKKKKQKPIYSTSETEEEYQAYMKMKPKWHGKGGHKGSWDPLQIASPPQIVQRPVGVVQKPKPQAKIPQKIERGAQVYPVSLQIYPGANSNGQIGHAGQIQTNSVINGNQNVTGNNGISDSLAPPNFERIQKSDSIIELRENTEVGARISRSVPKEVIRKSKEQTLKEETQAEILGLVKTNKETGQVEKTNDMDYEDYMNIINKVRKTKEHTRVRTEQARLSSMYAQELKRQEEIKLEEQRLKLERQRFEEENRNANKMPIITTVSSLFSQSKPRPDYSMEKGQLDNIEQEQSKISPSTSTTAVLPQKAPITHSNQANKDDAGNVKEAGNQKQEAANKERQIEEQKKIEDQLKKEREKEELRMLEAIQNEQIQQQKMREKQVLEEQKKLEKLKEEQIKQEKEREEIRQLEIERLRQIQEDQERLEDERRIQEEQIRLEQMRLEEERRKQEVLQQERQAQYLKQEEEMEAKAKALEEQKRLETERKKMEQINRQNSMSPREKLIHDKMRYQERLREEQLKEEAQIRQEKLNLIRQEEMLLVRQDEMLKQIQDEKEE